MITLFTIPKPFDDAAAKIQRTALASWARLPGVSVVLLGDEPGVAAAAEEAGARHHGGLETTEHGTPLVSGAFTAMRELAETPRVAFVNADIVLLPDFTAGLARVGLPRMLLAGRRRDLDAVEPAELDDPVRLSERARRDGVLRGPDWIDYFVLDRDGPLTELPPFVIGRPRWDNWLIHRARSLRIPVVDATQAITAIHQSHGHEHVPERRGDDWYGPEADANIALMGDTPLFELDHATHVLTNRGVRRALGQEYLRHRWRTRHDVDGGIERLGRAVEPVLEPALALRKRLRRVT